MRNKLIILSFAILASLSSLAQTGSFDQLNDEVRISFYPNPATEYIFVEFDEPMEGLEFELNSMIGNRLTVRPDDTEGGKYMFSLENLASGYYFLIIKDENSRFRKALKFLKN